MARKSIVRGVSVLGLLVILVLELTSSIRRETQTWDEAAHILAGYTYWTHADFGMNPEHPPLVKLLATAPLLSEHLTVPEPRGRYFKEIEFLSGHDFLYANNADRILLRTRMAAGLLTIALGLLIYLAGSEMFAWGAGVIALFLFVLEPSILAHGALVTTDSGFSLFFFASVYAFYRYVKQPSLRRLTVAGLAVGLALAAKHSGVLLAPVLILLAITELVRRRNGEPSQQIPMRSHALRLIGSLAVIAVVAVAILWAFYGFRYSARPAGEKLVPSLSDTIHRLHGSVEIGVLSTAARWKVLPEAYLCGLADVKEVAENSASYLFGTVYPHGRWFYFPAAMTIKLTIAFLALLLLVPLAILVRKSAWSREIAFLVIPPAVYFGVAMASKLNLGIRHILPIFPFLFVLAGMSAWTLVQRRRVWAYVVAVILLFDCVSSLRAFPNYIPYANELWGGSGNTYKLLTDSNADWGQQLKSVKRYLDQRGVKNCWFAYFADVVADPAYYGIPCKPLTTIASVWLQPNMDVPPSIDGPVLISAGVLSGYEFGPGELNPYAQFQSLRPSAVIDDGVFVFDGHFDVPLASALNHVTKSQQLSDAGRSDEALVEVQLAAQLAPRSARVQTALGRTLLNLNRPDDAREAFQQALTLARSVEPVYQQGRVPELKHMLANVVR
jgi:hypothetical protein